MPILTREMKQVLDEQRLGFVATVGPDGTPNLPPKGTTTAWDDDHLVFLDIHSPGTTANLRHNPSVEVNVVDPFARKGYRFKGIAEVLTTGAQYDAILAFYRRRGTRAIIQAVFRSLGPRRWSHRRMMTARPKRRSGAAGKSTTLNST